MSDLSVLIAAAGRGTRAGLPYPKTLYPVRGVPILLRIVDLLAPYDKRPTVVVSPSGEGPIRKCFDNAGKNAHIVLQSEPRGMGDAVLCFAASPAFGDAGDVLLVWGDIPLLQPETVAETVMAHTLHNNDFTFPTRRVDSAYTIVSRDAAGRVTGVTETREQGAGQSQPGEREIGLFVFRKQVVMDALREDLSGKLGRTTGEHGFLYVIEHLARRGSKVEAIEIAKELDLVSLNTIADVAGLEV